MSIPGIAYDWKALSIKQPSASLIVDGLKLVENRSAKQYKDRTLRGRWIMIHASAGSDTTPRGSILGIARIEGVYTKDELRDERLLRWANDGACIVFDSILKLDTPVEAPGGLSTWTLKPSPIWLHPQTLSKKERALSKYALSEWRQIQETKYRRQSLKKRVALVNIMLAIQRGEYTTTL
jgi:hypothetical protein